MEVVVVESDGKWKRGGNGGGWWVTVATNDLDAWNALVLSKSLVRVQTVYETCVIVTDGVSTGLKQIQHDVFDYVIELTNTHIQELEQKFELKVNNQACLIWLALWRCNTKKAIFIHPRSLVIGNYDQLLFDDIEEGFGTINASQGDFSMFVLKPCYKTYQGLAKCLASCTGEITIQQLLSSYFGESLRDFTAWANGRTGNELLKIIHFGEETPWKSDKPNEYSKIWMELTNKIIEVQKDRLNNFGIDWENIIAINPNDSVTVNGTMEPKDTVSIIGLSCRFPGANNADEFWELLYEGRDETRTLPPERYFTRKDQSQGDTNPKVPAGYLKCPIEEFDAKFFEISPREAEYMDPQHRLLLEVSWESLENAGINPQSLQGSNTGVFVGLWAQEYAMHVRDQSSGGDTQDFTHKYLGNAICATSARLSNFFGLLGPSIAFEAGCASSLQALHYGCEALLAKKTELVIAGGVNVVLGASSAGSALDSFILSSDGKCKTFDESANGFARAEACVALVLKRTSECFRDGDKILGIIRGSAINCAGGESSFGTPNALTQELVIKEALKNSGLGPNDISYIEAHGTGTPIGDPIEFHALSKVFGGKGRENPLYVGSVKTNIGHTEGASGVAGLVKVILSMKNHTIPRHLHLKQLNPLIDLNEIPAAIPLVNTQWKSNSRLGLLAGVSSFGLSGTNAHMVVQEPPNLVQKHRNSGRDRTNHIFVLSAKSEAALNQLVSNYKKMLEAEKPSNIKLANLAFSANTGRAHLRYRLAVVSKDTAHLLACLENCFVMSKKVNTVNNLSKVAFLFTGQGSQYLSMAKEFYFSHPLFKSSVDACNNLLKSDYQLDLLDMLGFESKELLDIDDALISQPAIFCIQVCLAKFWNSFGIFPDFVLGHSVGEFAAAVAAGVLSLADGMKLVIERSKLVSNLKAGSMLVLKTSELQVTKLVSEFNEMSGVDSVWVDIAAINSDSEIVVSGRKESIRLFEIFCNEKVPNLAKQRLGAVQAFHSRDMDLISEEYEKIASGVVINQLKCGYVSGTIGVDITESDFNPSYWVSHLRRPVRFHQAFRSLVDRGCTVFIEVGPQPVLLGLGMSSVSFDAANDCIWCPSIRKNEDNWITMLTSLGKLYTHGLNVDWVGFDAPYLRDKLVLPNYPFQREKHWFRGKQLQANSITVNSRQVHPILGKRVPTPLVDSIVFCQSISLEALPYLKDHTVMDKVILPAAAYIELVLAAGRDIISGGTSTNVPLALEDLVVETALLLKEKGHVQVQTIVNPSCIEGDLKYVIKVYKQVAFDPSGSDSGKWKRLISATFIPCAAFGHTTLAVSELKSRLTLKEGVNDIYAKLAETGINFGPLFRSIQAVWYTENEFLALVGLPNDSPEYICHPIVLDSMIQSCAAVLVLGTSELKGLYLPVAVKKFRCAQFNSDHVCSANLYIHCLRQSSQSGTSVPTTISLYSESGLLLCQMEGLDLVQTTATAFLRHISSDVEEYPGFYEETWISKLGPSAGRFEIGTFKHPDKDSEAFADTIERVKELNIEYKDVREHYDQLSTFYIMQTLLQLDWSLSPGETVSISAFCRYACIPPRHTPVVQRWCDILAEDGYLNASSNITDEFMVLKAFPTLEEVELAMSKIKEWFTDAHDIPEYRFQLNVGSQLLNLVLGKVSPFSVMFPEDNDVVGAISLFHSKPMQYLHVLEGVACCELTKGLRTELGNDYKVRGFIYRIIEVGAGTCSASAAIIEQLDLCGIIYEYTITDISLLLLHEASKKFLKNKKVLIQQLDIEKDPKTQGFPPHYYDLVICDNVVHATKNLSETLQNIRHLLVPSGALLLTEQTEEFRLTDISFVFLEGWWRFNDFEIRKKLPTVNVESWLSLLSSNGFSGPKEYGKLDIFYYSGILAIADNENYTCSAQIANLEQPETWVVFGYAQDYFTNEIGRKLRLTGKTVVTVNNSSIMFSACKDGSDDFGVNPCISDNFRVLAERLRGTHKIEGIIYLWGMNPSCCHDNNESILTEIVSGLLNLIKEFYLLECKTNLYVVTKGAQVLGEQKISNPIAAALWGLILTFNNEFSNQKGVCIDIDPDEANLGICCWEVFYQLWLKEDEHQIVFRNKSKFVNRLTSIDTFVPSLVLPNSDRYMLDKPASGSFDDFTVSATARMVVPLGEVEVQVLSSALNFKDVLVAMRTEALGDLGLGSNVEASATFTKALGIDFAGKVTIVGDPSTSRFNVGDRVFGFVNGGAISTHVVATENWIAHIPEHLSYEEASTIGLAYVTAFYFLKQLAQLNATDRVLIHTATGGVGLAAVKVAQGVGAEIFATAGSHRKRNYLKSLGIKHIYDSRNIRYGKKILDDTGGIGVSVVLNSLTGPNFKETTLSICAEGARFLEMSKLLVWTKEEMATFRPDVHYFIQDVTEMNQRSTLFSCEENVKKILEEILEGMASGIYEVIPYTTFPLARAHDAFRYLQEARQIGKVVINIPRTNLVGGRIEHKVELFNKYSTYMITGGLGGIGMEVAKWMASSGAKHIVLVGRNPPSAKSKSIISTLRLNSVNVLVVQSDVSDFSQCQDLLNKIQDPKLGFPKLKGIMHAAGELSDGLFAKQTIDTFWKAYRPKILGTWNLHILSQSYSLDHFVLFSSLICVVGGFAQANHCSANKYLDSFARFRVAHGLPCVSVNWGAWSDVGAAANMKNVESTFGIRVFSPAQGIMALERALLSQRTNTGVFDFVDSQLLSQIYNAGNIFQLLKSHKISIVGSSEYERRAKLIKEAAPDQRGPLIKEFIEYTVRNTLRISEADVIDHDQDLREMGIDSLMAMELRTKMQNLLSEYETKTISIQEMQEHTTINKLAQLVTETIHAEAKPLTKEEITKLVPRDCTLPDDIKALNPTSGNPMEMKTILLTGSTGHLGPYILKCLLADLSKGILVYCLIRDKNDQGSRERLERTLDSLELSDYVPLDNVVCLTGNLVKENFGLSSEIYTELTEKVDGIIHCAINSNLSLPYAQHNTDDDIRTNNVISLLNILRFATSGKDKVVQVPSGIFPLNKLQQDGSILDEFPSDDDYGFELENGYFISKLISEKLCKEAVARGINVQVLRHHYLCGDSKTGLIPIKRNHIMWFVLTCKKIERFPDIDALVTTVPVDIAAKASIFLFLNTDVHPGVYNINNPKVCRLIELSDVVKAHGYEFGVVPYNEWREAALLSQGLELAPIGEFFVNGLFSSSMVSQHTIVKHSLEGGNVQMFTNSDKLKKYIPDIDEWMCSPVEILQAHLDYCVKLLGRDTMDSFFDALIKG